MANLDSLNYQSITTMTREEGLAFIIQIRERRRIPTKAPAAKKSKVTAGSRTKAMPDLTPEQAARILKMLTGE